MQALKEFANLITLNMANLAATYARLLAERGGGYENVPEEGRIASGRKLLKAVVQTCESEAPDPLIHLFVRQTQPNQRWVREVSPKKPILEVESLGQTLNPVVTSLDAGKFLWEILFEIRTQILANTDDQTYVALLDRQIEKDKKMVPLTKGSQSQEEESIEQWDFLQALIDTIPSPIFYKGVDGKYIGCNSAYEKYIGLAREELVGKSVYDISPKELADKYHEKDAKLFKEPGSQVHEASVKYADGSIHEVIFNKATFLAPDGTPVGLVGVMLDISEQKRTQELLKKRAAELEAVAEAGTANLQLQQRVKELQCLNDIGRKTEEVSTIPDLFRWVTRRIPEAMQFPHLCQVAIEYEDKIYGVAETKNLPSQLNHGLYVGGEVKGRIYIAYTEKRNFLDKEGALLAAIATRLSGHIDNQRLIEQSRAALSEMHRSQELLQTIIDTTPDWIFVKDQEHRFRLVNQAFAQSLNLEPQDFIGKNDLDLGFPEEIVKGDEEKGIRGFWSDDREVMETGETRFIDVEPAEIDGQPAVLSTFKAPLRDADGNIWGLLGYARNITEQWRLLSETDQRVHREQTIREITEKMRVASSLEQLMKITAEGLGQRLSAGHTVVEFGIDKEG